MIRRRADLLAAGRLRAAIDEDRLTLLGQKIVPTMWRADVRGIECLAWVIEQDGSFSDPRSFMSAAHRFDTLRSLDRWVIQHALSALRACGGVLLQLEAFVESRVKDSELAPSFIMFEITETAAVAKLARAQKLISRLRRLGCRFALDDFVIGINALTYLKVLPVSCVKLDASFMRDIDANGTSKLVVGSIAKLAQSLNIACVADGVDSCSVANCLVEAGVPLLQGRWAHSTEAVSQLLDSLRAEASPRMAQVALAM